MLMIVLISLRPGNEAVGDIIPREISLEHWRAAFVLDSQQGLTPLLWLWNSIKVAIISSLLILALSTTAAYAFARLRFSRKTTILNSLLLLQMFPAVLALTAIYTIFEFLGEYVPWMGLDSHGALILAYCGGISEALVTTATGLTVAIPSLMFYRYFRGRVDALVVTMEQEALKMVEALHGPVAEGAGP